MPYLVQTSRINSSRTRYVYLAANSNLKRCKTQAKQQLHTLLDHSVARLVTKQIGDESVQRITITSYYKFYFQKYKGEFFIASTDLGI